MKANDFNVSDKRRSREISQKPTKEPIQKDRFITRPDGTKVLQLATVGNRGCIAIDSAGAFEADAEPKSAVKQEAKHIGYFSLGLPVSLSCRRRR